MKYLIIILITVFLISCTSKRALEINGRIVKSGKNETCILIHNVGENFFIYEQKRVIGGNDTITYFVKLENYYK